MIDVALNIQTSLGIGVKWLHSVFMKVIGYVWYVHVFRIAGILQLCASVFFGKGCFCLGGFGGLLCLILVLLSLLLHSSIAFLIRKGGGWTPLALCLPAVTLGFSGRDGNGLEVVGKVPRH